MAAWVIAYLYSLVLIFLVHVADWRSSYVERKDGSYGPRPWKKCFIEAARPCIFFSLIVAVFCGYVLIFSLSN